MYNLLNERVIYMLNQVVISNMYNFTEDVVVEFLTVGKNDDCAFYKFDDKGKVKISNISLLYGKNNVGKSNFFKAVRHAILFMVSNKFALEKNRNMKDMPSHIELSVMTDTRLIRYGFEFSYDGRTPVITYEWMYYRGKNSIRESLVFDRASTKFSKSINSSDKKYMDNVTDQELYLFYLAKSKNVIISDFIDVIKNKTVFLSCFDSGDNNYLNEHILEGILNNHKSSMIIADFMKAMDTGIDNFSIKRVEPDLLNFMKVLMEQEQEISKLDKNSVEFKNRADALRNLAQTIDVEMHLNEVGEVFGFANTKEGTHKGYSLSFVDNNNNMFLYSDLSSGTKQMFKLAMHTLYALEQKNCVMLFDEMMQDCILM